MSYLDIRRRPTILTLPGLMNSGPGHWQTLWEANAPKCRRVDLGSWHRPHRNSWISRFDQALAATEGPVLIAAHSLGCHVVAWWAALSSPEAHRKILGALLVAPPEVDERAVDSRLHAFGSLPAGQSLPFPSVLVASRNDHYMAFDRSRALAQSWGCQFADAGESGHVNAQSGLGDWAFGQFLLSYLSRGAVPRKFGSVQPVGRHDVNAMLNADHARMTSSRPDAWR